MTACYWSYFQDHWLSSTVESIFQYGCEIYVGITHKNRVTYLPIKYIQYTDVGLFWINNDYWNGKH